MDDLTILKNVLREKDMPMFTDEELEAWLKQYGDLHETIYHLALLKSESTAMSISGLSVNDTSAYFRRIAQTYRPFNSRILDE